MTSHHFPVEIFEKILLKLPTKSIVRFRCVCKAWRDLSKSYRFVLLQTAETDYICFVRISYKRNCRRNDHQTCSSELVVTLNTDALSWKELLDPESPQITFNHDLGSPCIDPRFIQREGGEEQSRRVSCPGFHFAGNCNGILCVTDFVHFFLINPSLREVKQIPAPPMEVGEECCYLIGVGFDNLTSDFKIVTVVSRINFDTPKQQRVLVYNLSGNSWIALMGGIPFEVFVQIGCSTFFNGVIHWCVPKIGLRGRMLAFNTTTHLFQQMFLPENDTTPRGPSRLLLNRRRTEPSLLVLNESLLAFVSVQSPMSFHEDQLVNVWVMAEYGVEESWTKLYSITTPSYIREFVSFWEEDKLLVRTMDGRVVLYDLLQGGEIGSIPFSGNSYSSHPRSRGFSLGLRVCKGSLISLSSV